MNSREKPLYLVFPDALAPLARDMYEDTAEVMVYNDIGSCQKGCHGDSICKRVPTGCFNDFHQQRQK